MENNNLSKEVFEAWLNSTTEYVYFKDLDGCYIATSKTNAELAGFETQEELIGKFDYEIFPMEVAQAFITQDRNVINTGETVTEKYWVEHSQKGKILLECIKSPLVNQFGKTIGVQGISRDITEAFKRQEKLNEQNSKVQIIIDNIPEPIWIKDTTNHYLAVNSAYESFYGVKREEITCQNVSKMLFSNKLFSQNEIQQLSIQDKEVLTNHEPNKIRLWTIDKNFHVEIIKSPIIATSGECVGLIGICHDITDRI